MTRELQQYLPLAVLKPTTVATAITFFIVATVPTACGIETLYLQQVKNLTLVATVPTACGIETIHQNVQRSNCFQNTVATVPTACGIETGLTFERIVILFFLLQQYLPLAVLKPSQPTKRATECGRALQQYLPLAVLKHSIQAYRLRRIECCNSTYRLRYATKGARKQRSKATMRPAHL